VVEWDHSKSFSAMFVFSNTKGKDSLQAEFFKNRITYIQLSLIFVNFNVRDFDLS
jgi:hypothetical protein